MIDPDLLRQIHLFRGLNQEETDALAEAASGWECRKGQFVFKEGDDSDVLYIVKSGKAAAIISTGILVNHTLATFGPGDIFGELAFIERHPRTASIKCLEHSELVAITRDDFRRLGQSHPNVQRIILKNIARVLAQRLRAANNSLRELAGRDKSLAARLPEHFIV